MPRYTVKGAVTATAHQPSIAFFDFYQDEIAFVAENDMQAKAIARSLQEKHDLAYMAGGAYGDDYQHAPCYLPYLERS